MEVKLSIKVNINQNLDNSKNCYDAAALKLIVPTSPYQSIHMMPN
jgi:hypothetical protein